MAAPQVEIIIVLRLDVVVDAKAPKSRLNVCALRMYGGKEKKR